MIEGLKRKLGEEAERLSHELNVVLPQEIRKAVELGDLRENSEYKAALERQQFVQARLGQLRQRLSKLSQIDVTQIPSDKVGLGSHVVVEDEKTGERLGGVVYRLQLDNFQAARRRGKLEHDRLADTPSDERLANGRRHTHVSFLELHRVAEHQAVALAFAGLLVLHYDLRAKSDFISGNLSDVDL